MRKKGVNLRSFEACSQSPYWWFKAHDSYSRLFPNVLYVTGGLPEYVLRFLNVDDSVRGPPSPVPMHLPEQHKLQLSIHIQYYRSDEIVSLYALVAT